MEYSIKKNSCCNWKMQLNLYYTKLFLRNDKMQNIKLLQEDNRNCKTAYCLSNAQ